MKLTSFKNSQERRIFLEKKLKILLTEISKISFETEKKILCENLIGGTTFPLGVAGPVRLKTQGQSSKEYYLPLATTEGALVASVNRGCRAISETGGAFVVIEEKGTTRGPVYYTENLEKGFWFSNWLKENRKELSSEVRKTSSHIKLIKIRTQVVGGYTFARFFFDCQEAMGMNMATIATEKINFFIKNKTGIDCLALSGNFCIDKKPAGINFFEGRGLSVWAEVILKEEIVKRILKTTTLQLFRVWLAKNMIGSSLALSLGYNGHFANIAAAFFAATGQDLAHTVEASLGITTAQIKDNDLYFSIYLPSLMLGRVGGGTQLKIKQEAISITQAKTKKELALVLAGGLLAGELSLLASLAEGSLAQAHQKLGR